MHKTDSIPHSSILLRGVSEFLERLADAMVGNGDLDLQNIGMYILIGLAVS